MTIEQKIRELAKDYATKLNGKIDARVKEMEDDDHSHFLIYRVLRVTTKEGKMIDVYQNKGRFVYKYAGSFLEEATKLCFKQKFPESGSVRIPNTIGQRPKTFLITYQAQLLSLGCLHNGTY
ncbi:MAG: ApaLI family restriction endonuclease [Candidatus Thiodiazotropha endolucinida]